MRLNFDPYELQRVKNSDRFTAAQFFGISLAVQTSFNQKLSQWFVRHFKFPILDRIDRNQLELANKNSCTLCFKSYTFFLFQFLSIKDYTFLTTAFIRDLCISNSPSLGL